MKIKFNQAREFLEEVNEKDSVMIFTHKDLDGFASGILLKKFCEKKGAKVDVRIIDYGTSKISDTNLKDYNKILLADLALGMVWEDLSKLKDKQILYTDHHPEEKDKPTPQFVLELRLNDEGYIPSSRTCFELTEKENIELKWLSVTGVLSDMGQLHKINDGFLSDFYKENKTNYNKMNDFTQKINDIIIFFSASIESFDKIAKMKNASDVLEAKEFYEPVEKEFLRLEREYEKSKQDFGNISYFYLESKYKMLKSPFVTGFSNRDPKKVFIFATPKSGSLISISGRNQSREYDVPKLMQNCLAGLKDGFAGGHKAAAGGQVDRSGLEEFNKRLSKIKVEEYKI